MTVGPRLQFTRFDDVSAKSTQWARHASRVTGVAVTASDAPPAFFVWQLVTGNSRTLGRSAHGFADLGEAIADARVVVERSPELELVPSVDRLSGHFGWFLQLEEDPVVVCGRWYQNERDRRQASDLAIMTLPIAQIGVASHTVPLLSRSASRHVLI